MSDYNSFSNIISLLFVAVIAIYGLLMLIIPQKMLKPALKEKPNGLLIGRIVGIILILVAAGYAAFTYLIA